MTPIAAVNTTAYSDPIDRIGTTYYVIVSSNDLGNSSISNCENYSVYTFTWNGTVNQDWFNPVNWAPIGVPSLIDDVIIPLGRPYYPVISAGNASCREMAIYAGADLSLTGGDIHIFKNLIISGFFAQTSSSSEMIVDGWIRWSTGSTESILTGSIYCGGNFTMEDGASFNPAGGGVILNGISDQYIYDYETATNTNYFYSLFLIFEIYSPIHVQECVFHYAARI